MENFGIQQWSARVHFRCFDGTILTMRRPIATSRSSLVGEAAPREYDVTVDVPGNVNGYVAQAVVAYWEGRLAACDAGGEFAAAEFDEEFVEGPGHDKRVDLIRAACSMGDEQLFELFRSTFGTAKNTR